nr:cadherin-like domain-containing protein [Psychrobacter sp. WY6]
MAATEDTVATGKLEAATDADGDALTYAIATGAANGKVVIGKDGSYSYTPNQDFSGEDTFTYTINDGQGGVITKPQPLTWLMSMMHQSQKTALLPLQKIP